MGLILSATEWLATAASAYTIHDGNVLAKGDAQKAADGEVGQRYRERRRRCPR
jgi:ABC-type lipopolysaccharide export system ATPase subunit